MSAFIEVMRRRALGSMLETIGLEVLEVDDHHALTQIAFRPEVQQLTGLFHTGALLAQADSTATLACLYAVDPTAESTDAPFPLAIQISANLIRNTGAGTVRAEARLVHRGRTTMVVETAVRDEQGRTLVLMTSTHLVLPAQGGERRLAHGDS